MSAIAADGLVDALSPPPHPQTQPQPPQPAAHVPPASDGQAPAPRPPEAPAGAASARDVSISSATPPVLGVSARGARLKEPVVEGMRSRSRSRSNAGRPHSQSVGGEQPLFHRWPVTLRYKDAELEREFRRDYYESFRDPAVLSLAIALTVWCLFIANDAYKDSRGERRNAAATYTLRVLTTALGIACALFIRYSRHSQEFFTLAVALPVLACSGAQIAFGLLEENALDPTYSCFMLLVCSIAATYFRLPWLEAAACNWALVGAFIVFTGALRSYDSGDDTKLAFTFCVLGLAAVVYTLHAFQRERLLRAGFEEKKRLKLSEDRSSEMLRRMLPGSVIERLKNRQEVFYKRHRAISVLFSNIFEFDKIATQLEPRELVTLLNDIFSVFDALTDKFGVYKVETIGDVYMVAAGVPDSNDNHAEMLCALALDMQARMAAMQFGAARRTVPIRIGINSGEVVAGVVGQRYPRYRLMGDTVNTASRMSTAYCQPFTTQVSPDTFALVRGGFEFRDRGEFEVRGKGRMHIYLLVGRSGATAAARAAGGGEEDSILSALRNTQRSQYDDVRNVLKRNIRALQRNRRSGASGTRVTRSSAATHGSAAPSPAARSRPRLPSSARLESIVSRGESGERRGGSSGAGAGAGEGGGGGGGGRGGGGGGGGGAGGGRENDMHAHAHAIDAASGPSTAGSAPQSPVRAPAHDAPPWLRRIASADTVRDSAAADAKGGGGGGGGGGEGAGAGAGHAPAASGHSAMRARTLGSSDLSHASGAGRLPLAIADMDEKTPHDARSLRSGVSVDDTRSGNIVEMNSTLSGAESPRSILGDPEAAAATPSAATLASPKAAAAAAPPLAPPELQGQPPPPPAAAAAAAAPGEGEKPTTSGSQHSLTTHDRQVSILSERSVVIPSSSVEDLALRAAQFQRSRVPHAHSLSPAPQLPGIVGDATPPPAQPRPQSQPQESHQQPQDAQPQQQPQPPQQQQQQQQQQLHQHHPNGAARPPMLAVPEHSHSGGGGGGGDHGQEHSRGSRSPISSGAAHTVVGLPELRLVSQTRPPMHPLVAAGGGVGGVVGAGSRMRAKEALEDGAVFQWGSFTSKMSNYSLRFSADEAEAEFRQQHFADYQDLNRYALLVLGVFVILLGFFDLGAFQSQDDALLRAWIMRLVMVLLISAAYLVNLSPRCTPLSMQVVTTGALAIVGVLLVQISLLFGREDDVYGIAVLMSVTSSSAIAFGLHFPFVCVVQAALLVAYVASNAIYERGFPLVTLFVITSSLLYAQSAYTTEYSNRTAFSQLVAREEEERRTTNLLNSMLPTEVLEELLSGGSTAIAHTFANASVLFADVVSFTAMAARMRPEDLVVFLNVLFSNFDRLSTTHNVYKVETIGDAYLACSGVVDAAPGHTRNLVEFGLDILDVSRRLETPDGDPVFLRVGIHTGAVVAGMVGFKMPRYHLFGDTYSIAESLESQGVKDSMVVSLATLQQLADEYESKEIEPIVCGGVPVRRFVLYGRRDA